MAEEAEEDYNLRIAVMKADLNLKTHQAFWETPRNIAILLTAVAAIAGFLGFKIGQKDLPPATPIVNVYPQIIMPKP